MPQGATWQRCVKLLIDSRGVGLKHCLFIHRAKGDDPS